MNFIYTRELFIGVIIVVLLVLLANPFDFWMPDMTAMLVVGALVVLFGIFSVFLWREQAGDEREVLHRMLADRLAFLIGSGFVVIAIAAQSLHHHLDRWLLIILGAMVLGKIAGIIYGKSRY